MDITDQEWKAADIQGKPCPGGWISSIPTKERISALISASRKTVVDSFQRNKEFLIREMLGPI